MSVLKEYLLRYPTTEGVRLFIEEMEAKYPQLPSSSSELKTEAIYRWSIQYHANQDRAIAMWAVTFLASFVLFHAAHGLTIKSSQEFTTYHYLSPAEVRRYKQLRLLKRLLVPLLLLGGLAAAYCFSSLILNKLLSPEDFFLGAFYLTIALLLFIGLLLGLQRLWKMERPPHAQDLRDSKLMAQSVKFSEGPQRELFHASVK